MLEITFSLDYSDLNSPDPHATLMISLDAIEQAYLSVANRHARNRTDLYQRRHLGGPMATRERPAKLGELNKPISEHYEVLQDQQGSLRERRVIAFPISDLTANPLRPHYDATIRPEQVLLFGDGSDTRLFYLEDEPLGRVPYTLLFSYRVDGRSRFAIQHEVVVKANGSLPEDVPEAVRKGLMWWAACPPLLINGEHRLERYAILDYDLRHVFGCSKGAEEEKEKREAELREMYQAFPDWGKWCETIQNKLRSLKSYETGYHAALGISEDQLVVVHRNTTIPNLANELKKLGAREAVLLDSGGSCAIWANWLSGAHGGMLAHAWNFRPLRGAVVFLVLKGKRYPEGVVAEGA